MLMFKACCDVNGIGSGLLLTGRLLFRVIVFRSRLKRNYSRKLSLPRQTVPATPIVDRAFEEAREPYLIS